ncbi:hypothetical protein ACFWGE_18520 [Streptomyces bacillaris]|uniref:Uncharacterized protein n=1 Tax=Streptomyces cavourensis TaxID=67258 RepID=A0AAD0Q159_9ACTN|nr:hypothetical protein [Streptomyces cavourensis]AXI70320.1 hypothetical protein DTW94_02765 [Streptomyces cavourensis]TQO28755.1 hypothetical protein FHX79_11543 [Streptomyces cavourensis]WAE64775.1 hypothetical protein OUQ49_03020 [Streptomyces cavourensis]GGU90193.1 hypothetical protein GCM10010498_56490 [Streptomyces cavourensis]
MYEGSIPLEDFLETMNRLQADFERRLGGIERKAPPAPPARPHAQERFSSSAWTPEDGYGPLGIEAIWTAARASPDGCASTRQERFPSFSRAAPADWPPGKA